MNKIRDMLRGVRGLDEECFSVIPVFAGMTWEETGMIVEAC